MRKASLTVAACVALLWAGMALGTQTAQEKCDSARITAWKTYVSCIETVVAKSAGCEPNSSCPASFNEFTAFAKCRHTYFTKWTTLQGTPYAGSTCAAGVSNRFIDNGTTVTDGLTGLVWEKKTGTVGGGTDSNPENVNNSYSWSTGAPYNGDGTAFTMFLAPLVGFGFAGANDWRLPTLAELQTIVADFPCPRWSSCSCGSTPCIDGTFGPTQSKLYWSATSYVPSPNVAWLVFFIDGDFKYNYKTFGYYVRAVRGGL